MLGIETTKGERASRLQERRELDALRKGQEQELPPLAARVAELFKEVQQADRALREAQAAHGNAIRAKAARNNQLAQAINQHEAALRETASPAIAAFIEQMEEVLDRTRHNKPFTFTWGVDQWGGQQITGSNGAQVRAFLEAVQAAIASAELLKLEAIADGDVEARLRQLRADLSAIDPEPVG